jgi:hypothetical protein
MKNPSIFIVFLSLISLISLCGCQPAPGPWVQLDRTDTLGGISAYNKDQVIKSEDRIQVSVRTVYYDESRDYITKLFGKKFEKFAYVINQEELNCTRKEYQIVSTTLYDTRHQALHTQTYANENWEKIPPGSDIDELTRILCK